jgi:hypothetical protein
MTLQRQLFVLLFPHWFVLFYFGFGGRGLDFERIPIEDAEMPRGDLDMLVAFPSEPPERG